MYNHEIIEFDKLRREGKQFRITIPTSKEETENILIAIKQEAAKSNADLAILKSLCFEIISRFPLLINFYKERFVLRSRPNYNGEVFNKTGDLSYNPNINEVHLGRFNLEEDPVFYCTDPVGNESFDATLTGMSESCKELFDSKEKITTKYFTIGKFNIIKPMKVIILSHYDKAESKCSYIKNINKYFSEVFDSSLSKGDWEKCEIIYSFFSERAGLKYDNNNNYVLTTAFYHAAKEYYGEELGILYSSSMTDNFGLNLVLSKELINAKYLQLEVAIMFKCVRDPSNPKHFRSFPCSKEGFPDKEGNFSIHGII